MVDLGFRGEVAELYQRYRRGYPPEVVDEVARALDLTDDHVVVDLGCGTGQLSLPLARRVRAVVGVDPEPDMLAVAARGAAEQGVGNVCWMVGSDADLPALGALLGPHTTVAVTVGQALHWMDHRQVFADVARLLSVTGAGGGLAVVTNGMPLWQQDTAWSRALAEVLREWLDSSPTATCGTHEEDQRRYREDLAAAGFQVATSTVRYRDTLDLDQIVGGVYSALPVDRLPAPGQRPHFAARVSAALEPHGPFVEDVPVRLVVGRPA